MEILVFIIVSIGVIVVPGPNVLVIVSTSLSHGKQRGLQTVAGTSVAMIIQLFIAAVGTSWFVSTLASGFLWLKWAGVLYLCYLGVMHLIKAARDVRSKPVSGIGSFQRGFWVSLTNPKTILFFSAFLPQFVASSGEYMPQIVMLSVLFWSLAIILDSTYVLVATKLKSLLSIQSDKMQNWFSGLLFMGASAVLANSEVHQ